ncbi:MAG: class I tRNA ligase family protein [Candidatus Nomurabacteria bacterium]|jgi:valyl-tRNA synthetase|nr:class I tRNA ligase family protein [Candidatus Nomurabacteria bacterium]
MKFAKTYEPNEYEPLAYALWEGEGSFKPSGKGEPYSVVMPPPNANGNLHIGHGLVTALEDILARHYRLRGRDTIYIPGADHAGFETWVVYERELEKAGTSRFDFSREELYAQVWDFVHAQRGNMELQLRALGASCSWSDLVFTLDDKVINTVYKTFKEMWEDGLIYRGKRLTNYCTKHQTAFADIEVDHHDSTTPLYYMKYGPFVLATTRPETKFGDTAVAVNPGDNRYKKYVGSDITVEGVNGEFTVKVIADDYVDPEFGTGVVKITPAHDFNDWEMGQRHDLPVVQVVNPDGRMNEKAGRFAGMTVLEAREAVVEALKEKDLLVKVDENYQNRVGVCYKCGTTIEPMLMDQWYINIKPLAKRAIEALEKGEVKFTPSGKKDVLIRYFEELKDWNISRQIPWGIPVPMFKSEAGEWIFSDKVDKEAIVVDGVTYTRDNDTLDTWFSSGQWPFITMDYLTSAAGSATSKAVAGVTTPASRTHQAAPGNDLSAPESVLAGVETAADGEDSQSLSRFYPNSVMETGVDLLFPWVSRMIMMGLYVTNKVPFKEVYMHGLVLDEKGQKMSKSKGNVINPMEVIAEYGSDAFRLGVVASRSAGQNQAFATSKVVAGRNLCNKLWNIARFVQDALGENYQPTDDKIDDTPASLAEHWVIERLETAKRKIDSDIKKYRFAEASEEIYRVVWNDVADWYIEASKMGKSPDLMAKILEYCLKLIHPFAPFVSETIWQNLSWTNSVLCNEAWHRLPAYDKSKAAEFEQLQQLVTELRLVMSELPHKKDHKLLYKDDSLVEENCELIKFLARLSDIEQVSEPKGLHLATTGRKVWLDLDSKALKNYKSELEKRLQTIEGESQGLRTRLDNENYIKKAPANLVAETKQALADKELITTKLKKELETL